MAISSGKDRVFLFLQGPHGPFFHKLGKMLRRSGATVWRVGFNAGDRVFWPHRQSYIPFTDPQETWPARFDTILTEKGITDIVLYGDVRTIHATAIARAREKGLTVHIFEEGYLRPYWVTYERDGSNGHSRLMDMTIPTMEETLEGCETDTNMPPGHWGDMRQHVFYGALYHWFVMFANRGYRNFRPHRALTVTREFQLYLNRFLLMPFHAIERRLATWRIKYGGFPYHLVLLQLEHDSSFQKHSPFNSMTEFLEVVLSNFAQHAPTHHHLVFKAHPLEDGRAGVHRELHRLCRLHDLCDRVHYVRGGKLAQLLNETRSAITVNSTAAQQVLWRGIPIKLFGKAVYDKPEFVSTQPLSEFFSAAKRPDARAYKTYRRFLLETSQVAGGFYSARGRRFVLRHVVDMMLSAEDPYDALSSGKAAPRQHLRLAK